MSEETKENVIEGLIADQILYGKKYEPGVKFSYSTCLPPFANRFNGKLALYLMLEHTPEIMCPILSGLMEEGVMPPGLIIFAASGILEPTLAGGEPRGMRTLELDEFSRNFSDFLVEELIPDALRISGAKLDPSPDMHFVAGASSGGTLAWNLVWFRNDSFRRAYLSSPTFAAERGGETILTLVRKTETRPIRLYMTAGTEEPAGVDGSSLYAALNAADTFEYAGYDFRYEQFNGEGHGCRREDPTLWRRIARFIWANWQSAPTVKPLFQPQRISSLLEPGSVWKEVEKTAMPEKTPVRTPKGIYTFSGGKIFLGKQKKVVASGFGKITALAISKDRWRLYVADSKSRYLFALSILPDGSLTQCCKFAPLHLPHDFHQTGATDLTVLPDGRVVAATELGIQGVWVTGMIDLILPLPGDAVPDSVSERDHMLYARAGNKVFCRPLRKEPVSGIGGGARSHLIP